MRIVLLAAIAAFASGPVLADSDRTGGYLGGSLLLSQVKDDDAGIAFDDSPIGWKVYGGYQFNGNWAVEGGYANLGKAKDQVLGTDVEVEFTGFAAHGLGIVPLSDQFELFGKLGFYSGDTEVSAGGVSADDSDSGLAVGGGVRYGMGRAFMLRADFDWYDVDFDSLWSLGVGATYNFR